MSRRSARPWLALLVTALAAAPAVAGSGPIYKCFDNHLALVYTDLPCKDGEQLDIRAGDADPAAVARLERERDQLDQMVAQRILDERHERSAAVWSPAVPQGDWGMQEAMAGPWDYGYVVYPTYLRRPLRHPRPHWPRATHGSGSRSPHNAPRR